MALFTGNIRSKELEMDTQLTVALPADYPLEPQPEKSRVLYLLHGLGENSPAWVRNSNVERYARQYGIALVMPEVQRSFYSDMAMGTRYFTYITQELPRLCSQLFQISTNREDTYIAGLSMGGYGALKCALSLPGQYAGCAGFSSLCHIGFIMENRLNDQNRMMFQSLLGETLEIDPKLYLFHLARQLACRPAAEHPSIYMTCGEQDYLLPQNLEFHNHLDNLGVAHRFEHWPGAHEWDFWDRSVSQALALFFGT